MKPHDQSIVIVYLEFPIFPEWSKRRVWRSLLCVTSHGIIFPTCSHISAEICSSHACKYNSFISHLELESKYQAKNTYRMSTKDCNKVLLFCLSLSKPRPLLLIVIMVEEKVYQTPLWGVMLLNWLFSEYHFVTEHSLVTFSPCWNILLSQNCFDNPSVLEWESLSWCNYNYDATQHWALSR